MESKDKETKKAQRKRYDLKRVDKQSVKGKIWGDKHPDYDKLRMRRNRAMYGREPRFMINKAFDPVTVRADECIVASDWHIPFQDTAFIETMFAVAKERGIKTIPIPGDFWDCHNFMKFTDLAQTGLTFDDEVTYIAYWIKRLKEVFDVIVFARGNHEGRWIDWNAGKMNMDKLFTRTKEVGGYKTTMDDHITLKSQGHDWLICHPRNFRQIQLSVGKDLSAKYLMNVFVAHGHQFAQGQDRSGMYKVVDGGGMFDAGALEYLRTTSTCPAVQGGFYIIHGHTFEAFRNELGANTQDRKRRMRV